MLHTHTRRGLVSFDIYLAELARIPPLTAGQERELARRVAQGDAEARDQLAQGHLNLVVTVARTYLGNGLPLEDLVGEGNLGLLRAVEGFDAGVGTRFATYATYWIRQSVRHAIQRDQHTLRLPHCTWNLLGKWYRASHALRRELGREPREEEVTRLLKLGPRKVRLIRDALRVRSSGPAPECEGEGMLNEVAVANDCDPSEAMAGAELKSVLAGLLCGLTGREARTLRLRFGLDGEEPHTLKTVGEQLGYTRERIRQIERDALAKLHSHVAV